MDSFVLRNDKVIYNGVEYDFDDLPENVVFDGDIDISCKDLSRLPNISSWVIKGGFYCYNNNLISLKGCPKEVNDLQCSNNKLTSLEYCPKKINGGIWCYDNKLTSLEGCPEEVGDNFNCSCNELSSLKGCPKRIGGNFWCHNNKLTSLQGCPEKISGNFHWYDNNIIIIDTWPKHIGGKPFYNHYCAIESVKEGIMPLKYLIYFYKEGLCNVKDLLMKEFGCSSEEELNAYLLMMGEL